MNRSHALSLAVVAALALGGCTPDFDPASRVDRLRVLAVRAEPPEIDPAGAPSTVPPNRAALESLVLRADFDAAAVPTTTVVHVACLPDPGSPLPTACRTFDTLGDLDALVAHVAESACAPTPGPAPFLAGVEACAPGSCGEASAGGTALRPAALAAPPGWFDALAAAAPGHPDLILGVQAVVLAFAIDATPDELVQGVVGACAEADLLAGLARLWPERAHVLATKQVHVRGPASRDPEPNRNPDVDELGEEAPIAILAGGTTLEPDAATTVRGGTLDLRPVFDDAARQTWTKRDAAGDAIETLREEWVYSWFATAGEIDELHTGGTESDEWTVGGTPAGQRALVAAVVRDLRGGVAWAVREVSLVP